MKLNAIGITTTNLAKTVEFYTLLGFEFPDHKPDEQHLEPKISVGSAKLMIDSHDLIKEILGTDPVPSNHSAFALEYETPKELDEIVQKLKNSGFIITKKPWDAFWGQRYAIVEDPDGYKVDLYASL